MRLNITIKEMALGIHNNNPLQKVPGRIIVELISIMILCLNNLPPSPSITGDLIPQQIVTGITADYAKIVDYSSGSMTNYTNHTPIILSPM